MSSFEKIEMGDKLFGKAHNVHPKTWKHALPQWSVGRQLGASEEEKAEKQAFLTLIGGEGDVVREDGEGEVVKSAEALTEVLFIIDKSGSMCGKEEAIVEGFNQAIAEQREVPGKVLISTVFFNHEMKCVHQRIPLAEVPLMTAEDYETSGCTALLDSVGKSVDHVFNAQKAEDASLRPSQTLVMIMTDGHENASMLYSNKEVKQMIATLQERYGWTFFYFGANVDHFAEASALGINHDLAESFEADRRGVSCCMKRCSVRIHERRRAANLGALKSRAKRKQ